MTNWKFGVRIVAVLGALFTFPDLGTAASFFFATDAPHITGQAQAVINKGSLQLDIRTELPGSVLDATDGDGLGVDSSSIAGATDLSGSKMNILGGVASGQRESVSFAFNQTGVIETLAFDGMKDETLEYFLLELPDGQVLTLFDFEVELRLDQQGFQLSDLGVPTPMQADGPSDDFTGLSIPFSAGQVFKLTYGEIDYDRAVLPGYRPQDSSGNPTNDLPNGSRFSGVVVSVLPEPAAVALLSVALITMLVSRRESY